ncbi:hypothetical protein IWQ56_003623 [Coemansia nantahalensis]|nr:hypothetical protein IWQ56_003623 [Coemansia nantahalensis]
MKAAILVVMCVLGGAGVCARLTSVDPDDMALSSLLGMRPDLVDMLGADGTNGGSGRGEGDALGTSKRAEVEGQAIERAECVGECAPADLGCRARCLGVPGLAGQRELRSMDTSGNLPRNWRMQNDTGRDRAGRSADDMGADDLSAAAGRAGAIPRLIAAALVLLAV